MPTAKCVMTQNVVTVHPETSVDRCIDLLMEHRISGLPVIDENGHMLGVISEFALLAITYDPHVRSEPVSDHMSQQVISVDESASLREVADLFVMHRIRRLPVTRDGKLVGLISRRDLLRAARETDEAIASQSFSEAAVS